MGNGAMHCKKRTNRQAERVTGQQVFCPCLRQQAQLGVVSYENKKTHAVFSYVICVRVVLTLYVCVWSGRRQLTVSRVLILKSSN